MTDNTAARETLLPCPFCGEVPDQFTSEDRAKWGGVVCCCNGPEVRTGYGPLEKWKAAAIKEWNTRSIPAAVALLREAGWTLLTPKCEICRGRGWVAEPGYPDCSTCNGTGVRKSEGG